MYIETVPNRASPPAILLRESWREDGKVHKRTLLNLTHWDPAHVEGLRAVLKGGSVIPPGQDAIRIERSLPHGHVAAVLGTARRIGLDTLLGPEGNRCRDLVLALLVSRILDPASKLATARRLSPDTASSSLGEMLGLGEVDEDELYAALDWLHERQPAIETALAKRHLQGGTLVLYDVSSSYLEGRCCPLAARGYSRDGKPGKLQITYGLLCAPDGCPVAIEVFEGNTGDPATLATQIDKLKQRFRLEHVVLVGDRGMITEARIREDLRPAGLDWITALRAPAIQALVASGRLQMTLFDERNMASITSPDYPNERLIVCRNPDLAAERQRKRLELLDATARDLARIQAAVSRQRDPLRGSAEIALKVGAVLDQHKMAKHFALDIADASFHFTSSAPASRPTVSTRPPRCAATSRSLSSSAPSAASRASTCSSARSAIGCPSASAPTSSSACSATTSNGTCVSAWPRCCSTTPTETPPRRSAMAQSPRPSARPPPSPSRPPVSRPMACPCTASQACSLISPRSPATPSPPPSTRTGPSPSSPDRPRSSRRRSISSASRCSQ
jgi:hypothetical protein